MRTMLLAAALAYVTLSVVIPFRSLAAAPPLDMTLAGLAGGGTIEVTFDEDMSGFVRVALNEVHFEPGPPPYGDLCERTLTVTRYFDPPAPVALDGQFVLFFGLIGAAGIDADTIVLIGQLDGTAAQGTGGYSVAVAPMLGCSSSALAWSASGPVDTPPSPDDPVFVGAIDGEDGELFITLDTSGTGITSFALVEATAPCIAESGPLSARAFFEPPLSPDAQGQFDVGFRLGGENAPDPAGITFTGALNDGRLAGEFSASSSAATSCFETGTWSASAALAATATPPPATPSPTSGSAPVALPDTGSRSDGAATSEAVLALLAVMGLGLAVSGALRLRAR